MALSQRGVPARTKGENEEMVEKFRTKLRRWWFDSTGGEVCCFEGAKVLPRGDMVTHPQPLTYYLVIVTDSFLDTSPTLGSWVSFEYLVRSTGLGLGLLKNLFCSSLRPPACGRHRHHRRHRAKRRLSTSCGPFHPAGSPTSTSSTPGTWTSWRKRPRAPSTARWRPRSRIRCAS